MKEIQVIKRNGNIENYDVSKIKKIIEFATKDISVNPLLLESKISSNIKNKIKTSEIQFSLISNAISLVSVDEPEWAIVAGRLDMYNLYRDVYKNFKIDYSTPLLEIITKGVNLGLYDKEILKIYTEKDIEKIQSFINPDYDLKLPISSTKLLIKKYLVKHKQKVYELPQFANIITMMFLCKNETNRILRIKETYEAVASLKISLATPFKANLRKPKANLSSCFIVEIDDNIDSINKTFADIAKISKSGGGVGVYLGRLRPSNSLIKGHPGGNNIVTWAKIIDDMAPAWNQAGIRKGAITISLDIFHKDIESFIEMKTESGGDVRQKCFNIYPQVIINTPFINAVLNDLDYPLLDRTTILKDLKIDICNLEEFNANYDKILEVAKDNKLYNCSVIKAKKLWKRLLEIYVETGELYIVCKDNMNKTNPLRPRKDYAVGSLGYINSYNLCVESTSYAKPSYDFKTEYKNNSYYESFTPGRTHTCNLISLNISEMNLKDIEKYSMLAVRMLDNAIDLTKVPIIEGEILSNNTRIIGVGVMGVADFLAKEKKNYEANKDWIESNIFERISYYTLKGSVELAKERKAFYDFENSNYYSKGDEILFLGKTSKELMNQSLTKEFDWITLLKDVEKFGVRNSQLFAVAPNTSSSLLCGCSASYLPVFSKFSYETLDKLNIPVVPKYLKSRFWYYKEYQYLEAKHIVELTNSISKWIDTGISMELVLSEKDNIKELSDSLLKGFSENLKAMYYSRTISKENVSGCVSCAN